MVFLGFFLIIQQLTKISIMASKYDKPISVRMESQFVRAIDRWLLQHPYWTRSYVINQAVGAILKGCNPAQLYEIVKADLDKDISVSVDFQRLS